MGKVPQHDQLSTASISSDDHDAYPDSIPSLFIFVFSVSSVLTAICTLCCVLLEQLSTPP